MGTLAVSLVLAAMFALAVRSIYKQKKYCIIDLSFNRSVQEVFMKEEFTTNARRWYDKDPVLSSAMKTLEESDDETQIKVALNLIKIIDFVLQLIPSRN